MKMQVFKRLVRAFRTPKCCRNFSTNTPNTGDL